LLWLIRDSQLPWKSTIFDFINKLIHACFRGTVSALAEYPK